MERDPQRTQVIAFSFLLGCALAVLGCDRGTKTTSPPKASPPATSSSDSANPIASETASPPHTAERQTQPTTPADSAKSGSEAHPHEKLFVDWPKPQFVLLVTGQQMGY